MDFLWAIFYTATHPIDRATGIMFSGCPSMCVCVCAQVEVFSDCLAVDFQFVVS